MTSRRISRRGVRLEAARARRLALAASVAASLLAGLALLAGPVSQAGAGSVVTSVEANRVGGKFFTPTFAASAPGYGRLMFVTERSGVVRVLRGGKQLRKPFLKIKPRVGTTGEGGLLSIAFPPDYRSIGRFYIYFTDNDGDVRVDEYRRAGEKSLRAVPRSRRPVISIPNPRNATFNHNGGTAMFGPDGRLWLAVGDGTNNPAATDLGSLRGKLLRINPVRKQGRPGYNVPESNPYLGVPGRDEIWAEGLRNPFRFSFDGQYIALADVGQQTREEVNYVTIAGSRGGDFGWPQYEGDEPQPPDVIDPIYDYAHPAQGNASVTGGIVAHDPRLGGDLDADRGRYLYADFAGALGDSPQSFIPQPGADSVGDEQSINVSIPNIAAFAEGPLREVYIVSLFNGVYRLDPAN
ncbi:MAG: PQQ-dependent sugar dehydrogenase [Solirubrobacterales bacterium]|nr:PQQ-dependent sugar dehydrogenase [Solirubrobacterales bacterium]